VSNPTIMADPSADIEMMPLEAVQAELQRYKPGHLSEVIAIEAYMARRARLWAYAMAHVLLDEAEDRQWFRGEAVSVRIEQVEG
jgi:hypothetical protein